MEAIDKIQIFPKNEFGEEHCEIDIKVLIRGKKETKEIFKSMELNEKQIIELKKELVKCLTEHHMRLLEMRTHVGVKVK